MTDCSGEQNVHKRDISVPKPINIMFRNRVGRKGKGKKELITAIRLISRSEHACLSII
jgi:hypothetical protein